MAKEIKIPVFLWDYIRATIISIPPIPADRQYVSYKNCIRNVPALFKLDGKTS